MKSLSFIALVAVAVISATAPRLSACYGGQNLPDPLILLVISGDAQAADAALQRVRAEGPRGVRRAVRTQRVLAAEIKSYGDQISFLQRTAVKRPLRQQGDIVSQIVKLQLDRADRRIKARKLEPIVAQLQQSQGGPRLAAAR